MHFHKPGRAHYLGLLQPLSVPCILGDRFNGFCRGTPNFRSANAILVVVDKFSKFAHFIALKHPFMAKTVAQLFLDNVYCLHGLPTSIISDRDKISPVSFGRPYLRQLVLLSASTPHTTRRRMDKPNG